MGRCRATPAATIAAFDEVIRDVQEHGLGKEELEEVKVKFRSEYYAMLEGGMGSYMPRFGLLHYLACFTLFDNNPQRVNTILDEFMPVTGEQAQSVVQKYLIPTNRSVLIRKPSQTESAVAPTGGVQ